MTTPPERPDKRLDLTRWNRAGLARFAYVDGDAAVWLEELRLAMMGLAARGAPFDERLPETWRDRFMAARQEWPSAEAQSLYRDRLAWRTLWRDFPDRPETAGKRNLRLLAQYDRAPGDHGWEIMRAFARASHVLLGHLDAYANEGYLRTATQWDNLRKLALMVNHQPAPPSSAVTTVGLILDAAAAVPVARGLAMKYAPPEGGAPVVFETLAEIEAHADLNAARPDGWDRDPEPLVFVGDSWAASENATLVAGAVGVLALDDGTGTPASITLTDVDHDAEAGRATLTLAPTAPGWTRGLSLLHLAPKLTRRGAPQTNDAALVLKIDTAANYPIGSIVKLHDSVGSPEQREVIGNADGFLKLKSGLTLTGPEVVVETLVPVQSREDGTVLAAAGIDTLYFASSNVNVNAPQGFTATAEYAKNEDGEDTGEMLGMLFANITGTFGLGYAPVTGAQKATATLVQPTARLVDGVGPAVPERIVTFTGKPPKGLATGDLFVMRPLDGGSGTALRVAGTTAGSASYAIEFTAAVTTDLTAFSPDRYEFIGPMTEAIRPWQWDRNPRPAFAGAVVILEAIAADAADLVRRGRPVLVEDERGTVAPVLGAVQEAFPQAGGKLKLVLQSSQAMAGFAKGWTTLALNAVEASHGETKPPRELGSGDGEKLRQSFLLAAREVSFIPSNVAETGVAPDVDVAVDGELWSYRDLTDPAAEGGRHFSVALNEDDTLTITFRRRLPTGQNNVVVQRYRSGVGPTGMVPARAFTKPMRKHAHVRAITSPLPSAGGAAREPIEDIRVNAPARLAANGRAVSLEDFARLARRRSDVWQARAEAVTDPSLTQDVTLTVVPAGGGAVGQTLRQELERFLRDRALPGIIVKVADYGEVGLVLGATVHVDGARFDKSKVQQAAHAALVAAFALAVRGLGQPVYIAEVAAALERVEGVATATVQTFAIKLGSPAILRQATTAGSVSALFPLSTQVIAVGAAADVAVAVEDPR